MCIRDSFTTARTGHTSVVYNGYLYVLGGSSIVTNLNDVQYASINANGTVGTWSTTTTFTTDRASHTSVGYNGYIYIIGGGSQGALYEFHNVKIVPAGLTGANTS